MRLSPYNNDLAGARLAADDANISSCASSEVVVVSSFLFPESGVVELSFVVAILSSVI